MIINPTTKLKPYQQLIHKLISKNRKFDKNIINRVMNAPSNRHKKDILYSKFLEIIKKLHAK